MTIERGSLSLAYAAVGARIPLQIPQRRPGGFAAGVAADHAAALFPTALAFDLVGGRAVLGHAAGHAHPTAVAAEVFPVGQARGFGNRLHPPGDLRFRQPEHPLHNASTSPGRMASRARMGAEVMATTVPWASRSVLEQTTVGR